MVKAGDTVRYLNDVGGGKVLRVEGKLAYVDDNGFETPVRVNELVVVLPAGHVPSGPGKMMFDQQAFDTGKGAKRNKPEPAAEHEDYEDSPMPVLSKGIPEEDDFPVEETDYGDDMTLVLAFEPKDVKQLQTTEINAVLVNDSNYFLNYQLLRRDGERGGWIVAARGEAAPNELVDMAVYTQQSIQSLERIVFQAVAWKQEKEFQVKSPVNVSRKLDLTKFYKLHCFQPGVYFETPVLEMTLYADNVRKKR